MIKIIFLGTAGSTFYRDNTTPCILVNNFLFDCPAECPMILSAKHLLDEVEAIFITHQHADHILGVFPLAWHAWLALWKKKIKIYGPPGIEEYIVKILQVIHPQKHGQMLEKLEITEIDDGDKVGAIKAVKTKHTVPTLAYRLEINGASFCYTGDTSPSKHLVDNLRPCDFLVHEATYPPGMEDKAIEDGHSTPIQAAKTALEVDAKILALVHIPVARLGPSIVKEYLAAAKKIFPETIIPKPGETYIVT